MIENFKPALKPLKHMNAVQFPVFYYILVAAFIYKNKQKQKKKKSSFLSCKLYTDKYD